MFDYAFKDARVTTSKEDYVEATGHTYPRTDNAAPKTTFTDGALKFITTCSIRGFVHAFAHRMCMSGVDKNVAKQKIDEFIELARRSGDISRGTAQSLKDVDCFEARVSMPPTVCRDTFSISGYGMDILDSAIGTYDWRFVPSDERKTMTEQEQAIFDNYDAAAKAFFEADTIRRQYYVKKATAIVSGLLAKYGETLRLMDEELLNYLQQRFKVETPSAE